MTKFKLTAAGDFSSDVVTKQIRQALHNSQTGLLSSSAKTSELRGSGFKSEIDFELPGLPIARDDLMDWVVDQMRNSYGGPSPFVFAIDLLPDEYDVVATDPAVEVA